MLDDQLKFRVAVVQVQQELDRWDGSLCLRGAGRRTKRSVEKQRWVWLDIRLNQPGLRAVSGVTSASAKELLPDDFALLLAGKVTASGDRLESYKGLTLFVYEPEDAAFKQAEFIEAGKRGILAAGPNCHLDWDLILSDEQIATIEKRFSGDDENDWARLNGLPAGCSAVVFCVSDRLPDAESIPRAWRAFIRLPAAHLSMSGGLRLGRNDHFVAGAGPQLIISGKVPPKFISIDGKVVPNSSRAVVVDQFSEVGNHEITAQCDGKTISRRFRVSHPKNVISPVMPPRHWAFNCDRWPVWESTSKFDSENEASSDEFEPVLFGARGVGLHATIDEPSKSFDDRLAAILLWSGMPHHKVLTDASSHPLVRQAKIVRYSRG